MVVGYRKVALLQLDYSKFLSNVFWTFLGGVYDQILCMNYKFDKFFERVNYTVPEHVSLEKVNKNS